jgi:hypothetical protein
MTNINTNLSLDLTQVQNIPSVSRLAFLSSSEKENISKWNYNVIDNSISTKIYTPFWNYLESLFPDYVSANTISFVGFLLNIYSFYLCYYYHSLCPIFIELCVVLLTISYMHLDAVDGKHARRTKNVSPLGELIDHVCDSCSMVFLILSFCHIFGITNTSTLLYIIQTGLVIFQFVHYKAFIGETITFGRYDGPCEIIQIYYKRD